MHLRLPLLPDDHAGDPAPPRLRAHSTSPHLRGVLDTAPPDALLAIGTADGPRPRICASYGLTEGGGVVAFSHLDDPERGARPSGGRPFAGMEIRIADPETDEELAPGEVGQILVRGARPVRRVPQRPGEARPRRCAAAGSTRATSASSTPTGASPTAGAARTCSRSAARTSRRSRSRRSCSATRRSRSSRSSVSPTRGTSRCRPPSSSSTPDAAATEEELIALLPRADRVVQGAALRALRRRVADVRDEDPEAPAARGSCSPSSSGRVMQHRIILVETLPRPSRRRGAPALARAPRGRLPPDPAARRLRPEPPARGGVAERLGSRSICSETWFADHDAEKASFASDYYRDDRHARRGGASSTARARGWAASSTSRRGPTRCRATACSPSEQSSRAERRATVDRPPADGGQPLARRP